MTWIDLARYDVALVIVVSFPGAVLFWLTIHPFVAQWRRVGYWLAYALALGEVIASALILYSLRARLMSVEFGTNDVLIGVAVPIFFLAGVVAYARAKQLKIKTLIGLPELAPDEYPGKLLTEGVYARVRHPRYLEATLGILSWALFANYLATYVVLLFWLVALLCVLIPLEERELLNRFGAEYKEYRRRVPMIVPRIR